MGRLSSLIARWSLLFWVLILITVTESRQVTQKSDGDDLETVMKNSIFFNIGDIKAGKTKAIHFPFLNADFGEFIRREEAESIPFTEDELPRILDNYGIARGSQKAKLVESTLDSCTNVPPSEVFNACFTSFESILETVFRVFNISSSSLLANKVSGHNHANPSVMNISSSSSSSADKVLGHGHSLKIVTTVLHGPHETAFQNYTILGAPREVSTTAMFGCHQLSYPYAVHYCHVHPGDSKLFQIPLLGERNGVRVNAMSECSFDTSDWDANYFAFHALGSKPGNPVCHFFHPYGNFAWVHTSLDQKASA